MFTRQVASLGKQHHACLRYLSTTRVQSLQTRKSPIVISYPTKYHTNTFKSMSAPLIRTQVQATRSQSTDSNKKSAKDRIDDLINNSKKKVFVFMKGVPEQPACGYSNAVVQILNAYDVEYDSFNVLDDDEIRKDIKAYSNWPTIPQVYVNKNFVGGCDILIQMHQNNELEKLFENSKPSA